LADPFWVGETPFQAYNRFMKAQLDDFPEYEPEPDYIPGGQKKKKKHPTTWPYINSKKSQKKPTIKPPENPGDDVPF
jgi:hypothetical protein